MRRQLQLVITPANTDTNNGTPNPAVGETAYDLDGDGFDDNANWLDLDSDDDGITDLVEAQLSTVNGC